MSKSKNAFKSACSLAAAVCAALVVGVVIDAGASQAATKYASLAAQHRAQPVRAADTIALFFDVQSAELTPEAQAIVREAVKSAERVQASRIELTAYSAPDELKRDRLLASHRAAAVRAYMEQLGFEGDVVAVGGPDPHLVSIGLNDDTLSRRVILRLS